MIHRLALPCLLVFFLLAATHAGPAPYASARIYFLGDATRAKGGSPEELRKNAKKVVSISDIAVVDFWSSIKWSKAKTDKNISSRAKPLIMIIDFYGRTQPPFEGRFETLYCSPSFIYSDSGDYMPAGNIFERAWGLAEEEKR